jgi:DnaJ-class molecular chaperone
MKTCELCNGTGRDKPEQTCPNCNGSGVVVVAEVSNEVKEGKDEKVKPVEVVEPKVKNKKK